MNKQGLVKTGRIKIEREYRLLCKLVSIHKGFCVVEMSDGRCHKMRTGDTLTFTWTEEDIEDTDE